MFERYTEKARRSIFFARYEASQLGALEIEPYHLLLGVLRESDLLRDLKALAAVRDQIAQTIPRKPVVSTSVDMPLARDAKRALVLGAEEAGSGEIDCTHLLLGILRVDGLAADLLREAGLDYDAVKRRTSPPPIEEAVAEGLTPVLRRLLSLPQRPHCYADEVEIDGRKVTPEVAAGYLIERACAYLTSLKFTDGELHPAENYAGVRWPVLEQTWRILNRLIANALSHIPQDQTTPELIADAEAYAGFCERISAALDRR